VHIRDQRSGFFLLFIFDDAGHEKSFKILWVRRSRNWKDRQYNDHEKKKKKKKMKIQQHELFLSDDYNLIWE
jgi:hypothetical protein